MSFINNFDNVIKFRPEIDFDLASNKCEIGLKTAKSVLKKGSYYKFLDNASANSHLCYNRRDFDLQPWSSLNNNLISSGNQSYVDFKLQAIPCALYEKSWVYMTVNNTHATITASLFSAPNWFYATKVLKSGVDSLQSYDIDNSSYIQTCVLMEESRIASPEFANYGISPTTYQSVLSIPPLSSIVVWIPIYTSLYKSYIPLDLLSKQETVIRSYINSSILYNSAGNVALSNLTISQANLRIQYIEIDKYENSMLTAEKFLNFKTFVKRLEVFQIPSLTANQIGRYQFQSTRGTWSQMFVWLSQTTKTNTNIDTFQPLSGVWVENSTQQNIFNQLQYNPQYLALQASKAYGGSSFFASNPNIYLLPPFTTTPKSDLENNVHSGGYAFTDKEQHYLAITSASTLTALQVNVLTFTYGMLTVMQNGDFFEQTS